MKVSMDGLRASLTSGMSELRRLIVDASEDIDGEYTDDLWSKFNDIACQVNCLNCIYDDDNELFNDVGHLEVELLDD